MWISKRSAVGFAARNDAAETGFVTIGGASPAVLTDGERRDLPVCGPGGYRWTPKTGSQVLVIKTGDGEHMVMGSPEGDEPEEIRLSAGGAEICLKNGTVTVRGSVAVTGSLSVSGSLTVAGRTI